METGGGKVINKGVEGGRSSWGLVRVLGGVWGGTGAGWGICPLMEGGGMTEPGGKG